MIFSTLQTIMALLIQSAETAGRSLQNDPQFWVTLALVLTFATDMVRRFIQRRWEKQDKLLEKEEEKAERAELEAEATWQRQLIADEVKARAEEIKVRLELQQLKEAQEREKLADTIKTNLKYQQLQEEENRVRLAAQVIGKIEEQENVVKETSAKVVTLTKAGEHQQELIEKIDKATDIIVESKQEAHNAYEIANTINKKLENMSEAGLLDKGGDEAQKEIAEIETAAKTDKGKKKNTDE